jgi:hypothetical protein
MKLLKKTYRNMPSSSTSSSKKKLNFERREEEKGESQLSIRDPYKQ